jgi:transcriptional regulator GlxA family with amidase domain
MLRNVAAVALNEFGPFELGVLCEVFGTDRSDEGLPSYDFAVVAGEPGPLRSETGFTMQTPYGLERLAEADLIAIPAAGARGPRACEPGDVPDALLDALRAAVARGARVLSVCTGVFVLGAAGLLDGRRCTTHWRSTAELTRRWPAAKVEPDVLYVDDDPVYTSAGTAAGIDACLYLVRKEQGSRVANTIARRMVVPPHRDGGQAQFVDRPMPECAGGPLAELLGWLEEHLDEPVTVDELAARAHMSPRTFARRFVAETGTTPLRWLTGQRVLLAQQLLEESGEGVDRIAEQAGFGNATALRHHFRIWRGTTPQAYRQAFRGSAA